MNEIKVRVNIELWKSRLKLNDWRIITVEILPAQVVYADDVPEEDKYFIGILPAKGTKEARIFHDRPLKEEDIVHELLHVKHPEWSEEKVLSYQDFIIAFHKECQCKIPLPRMKNSENGISAYCTYCGKSYKNE